MIILPAIDLIDGKCVRLVQGDFNQQTTYGSDPLSVAIEFEKAGAEGLHIVDLQGAKEGRPCHLELVSKMIQSLSIPVQIGGGIRNQETIEAYHQAGAQAVILGSMIFDKGVCLESLVQQYGSFIRVGIDVKSGVVRTHGWLGQAHMDVKELLSHLESVGVEVVIYTDIHQDGMLSGINVDAINQVLSCTQKMRVIISGGVAGKDDVSKAYRVIDSDRIYGLIVGKALYDKKVTLKELLEENHKC